MTFSKEIIHSAIFYYFIERCLFCSRFKKRKFNFYQISLFFIEYSFYAEYDQARSRFCVDLSRKLLGKYFLRYIDDAFVVEGSDDVSEQPATESESDSDDDDLEGLPNLVNFDDLDDFNDLPDLVNDGDIQEPPPAG